MSRRLQAIRRIFGAIIGLSALIPLPPLALALYDGDATAQAFFDAFAIAAVIGLILWYPVRSVRYELRLRDGFLITAGTWVLSILVASIPFRLAPPYMSWTDAVFEATSGLTTTGATVIVGLEALPRSVLFYRALLCYLGGMGIVILAVAILPMLKVGGMQLFRAESTGPTKDSKLTPRIADTAKALWAVYTGLILICAICYWLAGMSLFDAICHGMTTVGTAGFGNYDLNLGHFDSATIEVIATVFMFLGGCSFGLHWYAWRRATVNHYLADAELKLLLRLCIAATLAVGLALWLGGRFPFAEAMRHAAFQVVSNVTTTGYTTVGFTDWPGFAPLLLVMLAFVGGCAGSTSGGIKVARVQMVVRQGLREIKQLVHPKGQFLVKVGGKRVSESVVISVAGFCTLYILSYLVMTLLLAALGVDLVTAWSAIAASLNNLGPGMGEVAMHFRDMDDAAVWICSFAMVLGRLEVFTLLVLFTPQFWQE
ncbi:TrkH family potassium uptake protein [Arenimonas composti]|uniref:Trk system potassium uptake protein n=1 Tax=Arenimonas composti TR7-09 = DSM 18010 TaxID=1121013 RepID=A0A091BB67_9GAMM|nr:TrkH family potassium uptake protein [Arenimonas composti]KFN49898.1 hypothetical protein P873_08625 [Arenimonas composti TR7-09 = DSM 18010]